MPQGILLHRVQSVQVVNSRWKALSRRWRGFESPRGYSVRSVIQPGSVAALRASPPIPCASPSPLVIAIDCRVRLASSIATAVTACLCCSSTGGRPSVHVGDAVYLDSSAHVCLLSSAGTTWTTSRWSGNSTARISSCRPLSSLPTQSTARSPRPVLTVCPTVEAMTYKACARPIRCLRLDRVQRTFTRPPL